MDINYIKETFCRFKCGFRKNISDIKDHSIDIECYNCDEEISVCIEELLVLENLCKVCPVDGLLKELEDWKEKIK